MPSGLRGQGRLSPLRRLPASLGVVFHVLGWMTSALGAVDSPEVPAATPQESRLDPEFGVGSWIWAEEAFDKQTCRFWRAFEIPPAASVQLARLRITADNGYRAVLDGQEIGRGSDWRSLTEYDLSWVLPPGIHVLAVEAFNDRLQGGVLLGLQIELNGGRVLEIASDNTWRVVPRAERGWEKRLRPSASWPFAIVVGEFGAEPWSTKPYAITPVAPLAPAESHFWQTGWVQVALLAISVVAVLVCLRLMAQLAVQSRAQRLLQRERDRIARDIHDDLGAGLTQLVLLSEVMKSELPATSGSRRQIEEICNKARGVSHSMDEIVWAVNSRRDTLRDFATHMCKFAQMFLRPTSMRCRLDVEADLPSVGFDLPQRRNLFLAVKEAINNAAKHSEATELFLRIRLEGKRVVVEVEDNGRGFDPSAASTERNGLKNMAERMHEAAGTWRINSHPERGCRVEFIVPLHQRHSLNVFRSETPDRSPVQVRPDARSPVSGLRESSSGESLS